MRKVATLIVIGIFFLCVGNAFAKQEFYGVVQAMPEKGYVGQWNVDGKTVHVTEDTKIEEKHGKLAVGAYVEVEGVTFEGKFIASEIETKKKK
ncbi:MAG: DUF5666 domain-containing protein [Deltaproteobacteria bacterium]|jgi:hypothetical protein